MGRHSIFRASDNLAPHPTPNKRASGPICRNAEPTMNQTQEAQ